MEPVMIKKGKKTYAFSSEEIMITRENKSTKMIRHDEIREITYNPKFGLKDIGIILAAVFLKWYPATYTVKAFVIYLKETSEETIIERLSNDEFEKIKDTFRIPVRIV